MSDSHSMAAITETLSRRTKCAMCFQLTNGIYIIGEQEAGLGGEKSVIDKYLDEVSKVSFKVVFVKLDFVKEMGERERKKKGEAEEEVVGERGRERGKIEWSKGVYNGDTHSRMIIIKD